jgi:hypothetical protein
MTNLTGIALFILGFIVGTAFGYLLGFLNVN